MQGAKLETGRNGNEHWILILSIVTDRTNGIQNVSFTFFSFSVIFLPSLPFRCSIYKLRIGIVLGGWLYSRSTQFSTPASPPSQYVALLSYRQTWPYSSRHQSDTIPPSADLFSCRTFEEAV